MIEKGTSAADMARRPLGEIAVAIPGAAAVFRRNKLDFCCGGGATLGDAARKKNLDVDRIFQELAALSAPDAPLPEDTGALIDRIVATYHDGHRRDLPELIAMAERVERVHADRPDVPAGLAHAVSALASDLYDHMQKEEEVLFPMMRRGGSAMISQPISVMRYEHTGAGEDLATITELTNDFEPPQGACNTWRALYLGLRKFSEELTDHIHLENNVLFPRFGG